MATFATPPFNDPIVVPESTHPMAPRLPKFFMGKNWMRYLGSLVLSLDERPERKAHRRHVLQEASLGTTPIPLASIPQGVWRITVQARVTRAATASSSLQVTISWTQGGLTQSASTAAITGNTTTTRVGEAFIIRVDDTTSISYATTYSSTGATAMQYELDVAAELLAADTVG